MVRSLYASGGKNRVVVSEDVICLSRGEVLLERFSSDQSTGRKCVNGWQCLVLLEGNWNITFSPSSVCFTRSQAHRASLCTREAARSSTSIDAVSLHGTSLEDEQVERHIRSGP